MRRDRIILWCDYAIVACLCSLIFCLPFSKSGAEAFTWIAFSFWILKRLLGYRGKALWGMLPGTELNKALAIFIAINAISVIYSANLGLSLRGFFLKELKFIAIYFMIVEIVKNEKWLRSILLTIIFSAGLMIADAAMQYVRGVDFLRGYSLDFLRASFLNANSFAGWLIVIITLFLALIISDRLTGIRFKFSLGIFIILLLLCLVMTYARGAWLGFLIAIPMMAWYVIRNLNAKSRRLCLYAGICFLALLLFLPQPIKSKINAIGKISFKTGLPVNDRIKSVVRVDRGSIPIRINLWKESLKIIREYPVVGCGLNTYSIVAKNYKNFADGGTYPHNSFLQMAAETGLLGLAAFLWLLFIFFKVVLDHINKKDDILVVGLAAGILAFLVQSFFDTHLYSLQLAVLFWYMLGLTVAAINIGPKRR